MIMDGFGFSPPEGNAIAAANKPTLDKLFAENPLTQIGASGMDVGLPDGQMGNGRPHEHRRRPHRVSGADPHHEGRAGRHVLRK